MAGRLEGLSGAGRSMFEEVFPEKERKGPGMPARRPRSAMNSLLHILVVGCRRLKTWHSDGAADKLKARILGHAQPKGRSAGVQEPPAVRFPPANEDSSGIPSAQPQSTWFLLHLQA